MNKLFPIDGKRNLNEMHFAGCRVKMLMDGLAYSIGKTLVPVFTKFSNTWMC